MKRSAIVLIATRPNSKRLPGKVFRKVAGIPAIEHILKRLIGCNLPVVLCVPYHCSDYNHLVDEYKNVLNLMIYYGDVESPLHRMAACIQDWNIDEKWVVRITHDDLLIDQKTMLDLIDECDKTSGAGYGISPDIVEGAGVEVFRTHNLLYAAKEHTQPTEFVSYFVKNHPFSKEVRLKPRRTITRDYRLTMDYEEDFVVLDMVLQYVGPLAPLDKVVEFIDQNPHVLNINHIPKISIYTCAYNAAKTLGQTLSSVLWSNRYTDFEYILVDDCSTDKTRLRASEYITTDKKIRILVNEKNEGLASSSNRALNVARGQYVMRVDADDWMIPGAIEKLAKAMADSGAGIIYPSYYETDMSGKTVRMVHAKKFHHAGCALMDKRLINEIRFSEGMRHWDGLDLYNRVVSKGFQISYFDEPLWYYRLRPTSMSRTNLVERRKVKREVMKKCQTQ